MKRPQQPQKQQELREIDSLLKLGGQSLRAHQSAEALDNYQKAYRRSVRLANAGLIRACAFNLGACLVARGDCTKAIKYLQLVLPSEPEEIPVPYIADVHYNLAGAHEKLGNREAAQQAYRTAFLMYGAADKAQLQCEVAYKIASDAESRKNYAEARSFYQAGARACEGASALTEWRLRCQVKHAACCHRLGDTGPLDRLAQCEAEAHLVPARSARVELLNEIGLTLMQAGRYAAAGDCFATALHSVVDGATGDIVDESLSTFPGSTTGARDLAFQRAGLLQNAGGALTALGRCREALAKYTEAVRLFGQAVTPCGQSLGHCQLNMAMCHACLGQVESSARCYEAALQLAREAGDKSTQWRALEGLGAVDFNLNRRQTAVARFAEALGLVGDDAEARERLTAKLQRAGAERVAEGERDSQALEEPVEVREARMRLRQAVFGSKEGEKGSAGGGPGDAPGVAEGAIGGEESETTELDESGRSGDELDDGEGAFSDTVDDPDRAAKLQAPPAAQGNGRRLARRKAPGMLNRALVSTDSSQNVVVALKDGMKAKKHKPQSGGAVPGVDTTDFTVPRRSRLSRRGVEAQKSLLDPDFDAAKSRETAGEADGALAASDQQPPKQQERLLQRSPDFELPRRSSRNRDSLSQTSDDNNPADSARRPDNPAEAAPGVGGARQDALRAASMNLQKLAEEIEKSGGTGGGGLGDDSLYSTADVGGDGDGNGDGLRQSFRPPLPPPRDAIAGGGSGGGQRLTLSDDDDADDVSTMSGSTTSSSDATTSDVSDTRSTELKGTNGVGPYMTPISKDKVAPAAVTATRSGGTVSGRSDSGDGGEAQAASRREFDF